MTTRPLKTIREAELARDGTRKSTNLKMFVLRMALPRGTMIYLYLLFSQKSCHRYLIKFQQNIFNFWWLKFCSFISKMCSNSVNLFSSPFQVLLFTRGWSTIYKAP